MTSCTEKGIPTKGIKMFFRPGIKSFLMSITKVLSCLNREISYMFS